ncbi:MAG: Para-hydroxybenzoate--polyprenyltransferase, mitochondrial precursor (PHB:polyprenyltransferase) [Icmadophila ericetorum]|nr:Para-hydroxybenzoate--polyprenyltransferase, mitochondrial precursor (PHB:polyprenyltransferase) [Icmadophila ericetorum]
MEGRSEKAASPEVCLAPQQGLYSYLPELIIPYAELIRAAKPAGTLYLYIPSLAATLIAASMADSPPSLSDVLTTAALFLLGSTIFRGAACTWNDILDQDIDRRVTRTRSRPLPRGAISTEAALLYNAAQTLLGLLLLSCFPWPCVFYSLPSIALIILYPLGKRFTHYPQVILGFTWSYGFVIAFPAMGVDLLSSPTALRTAACFYGSGIAWTIFYDTIYAHQDIQDDKREGVKSIAIKFEATPKLFLGSLGVTQVLLFIAAGTAMSAGNLYYLSCLSVAATLAWTVRSVDLSNPTECAWWFHRGSWWLTGGSIVLACLSEYVARLI